ncbi:hypothetical protein Tco_0742465 [Tanacetum coccineum]
MSNSNNKQPLDLTDSLPVDTGGLNMEDRVGQVNALKAEELQNQMEQDYDDFDPSIADMPSIRSEQACISLIKHPAPGKGLGIPKIKKPVAPRIPSQNDSLDIPASSGTCQVL